MRKLTKEEKAICVVAGVISGIVVGILTAVEMKTKEDMNEEGS